MANATITLQSICDGGEHCVVRLTVGAQTFDFQFPIAELDLPIAPEERREAVSIITRFHCGGMTHAEAKAELQPPGINVQTT